MIKRIMKYLDGLYPPSYIILNVGLCFVLISLSFITYYLFSDSLRYSETTLWLQNNSAEITDTILASFSVLFIGVFLLDYSHKKEK